MIDVRKKLLTVFFAIFLISSLAVPAMAGKHTEKTEKKGKPIVILCDGDPGQCPCPGC